MKALPLLVIVGLVANLERARAEGAGETVQVGVDFELAKCTKSGDEYSCVTAGSVVEPAGISIALECASPTKDMTACAGHWDQQLASDGNKFESTISVAKVTSTNATTGQVKVTYSVLGIVGPVSSTITPTLIRMDLNRGGGLTDAVTFRGPEFSAVVGGTTYLYETSMRIGPPKTSADP